MIKSLSDVIGNRNLLISQLEQHGKSEDGKSDLFDSARMDGVVVIGDLVMKRYLECLYVYNTHIAPHCLPGVGISVGDILNHEGKDYLTLSYGVMATNVVALHSIRKHEAIICGMGIKA